VTKPGGVCVLGMHRSGTSLVARLLNLLGVDLGPADQMMPAMPSNPRGHWEQQFIVELNDEILRRLGGSWSQPPVLPTGWEESPLLEDLRGRARILLDRYFSNSALWGWKDPRACLTLPFWRQLVPRMQYVICLRNVVDVARSLEHRDGMSIDDATQLWLSHTLAALTHTTGEPRLLFFYDDLVTDWRLEARRLAAFLGRADQIDRSDVLAQIEEEVDPSLRHHSSSLADVLADAKLPGDTKALYVALWTSQHEATGEDHGLTDTLRRASTSDGLRWFADLAFASLATLRTAVELLEGQLSDSERRLTSSVTHAEHLDRQLSERERSLASSVARAEHLQAQLREVTNSLGWRLLTRYRAAVSRLAPVQSWRRRLYSAAISRTAVQPRASRPPSSPQQ
jgi:hypothetical protein